MNVILVYESSSLFFKGLVNPDVGACGLLFVEICVQFCYCVAIAYYCCCSDRLNYFVRCDDCPIYRFGGSN